ncbi:MAG: PiT family inorganic phosphate transporter, partial [Planctomycetota bacterium]
MTWILVVGLLLAFANGANDNLKGVASLLGSRRTSYRRAVAWATLTTMAGSLAALLLAGELIGRFQGKGLVPPELIADPNFLGAVALAASLTVLLATRVGLPISTTHALVGALVGAGLAAVGSVRVDVLAGKVLAPLLVSPLLALVITAGLYRILRRLRARLRVEEQTCFCVGTQTIEVLPVMAAPMASIRSQELSLQLGTDVECSSAYNGRVLGLSAGPTLDTLHFLSGGALGFARGLNDTPKI